MPDVIENPGVEAELVTMGGVSTPIPMTLASSTAADGTLSIEQGWYTGAIRIYDSGALNAGIVRAVRIASGATTTWEEFLTVNQLQGAVTIDLGWYSGDPLTLATNPPEGEVVICQGASATLAVTGADNDAGTTVVYAWYLNGVLTALGSGPSLTVDGAAFVPGAQYYLSCVAYQSDGKRAGDAQWTIVPLDVGPEGLNVRVLLSAGTGGEHYIAQLYDYTATTVVASQLITDVSSGPRAFEFADVPVGRYYVHVFHDVSCNGAWAPTEQHRWWQPVADSAGLADVPSFAANVVVPNDGSIIYTLPNIQ